MGHTFLLEPGRWTLEGNWLERDGTPINVKGITIVAWNRDEWFTMVTKLIFPRNDRSGISLQYRGRLDRGEKKYTFLLSHNIFGSVEGEGWIGKNSIVQQYWVLGNSKQRNSGFETLYQVNQDTYYVSGGSMSGHFLTSTMEASLERQLS
ncbi:MAG: hypothetical protein AAF208_03205 [Cyanobacteria bacterium P01_A01_bin.45]